MGWIEEKSGALKSDYIRIEILIQTLNSLSSDISWNQTILGLKSVWELRLLSIHHSLKSDYIRIEIVTHSLYNMFPVFLLKSDYYWIKRYEAYERLQRGETSSQTNEIEKFICQK